MNYIQANQIRKTILKMIFHSKSSHIGSALSIVDVLAVLYSSYLKEKDRIILSKGHAGSALYATIAEAWYIDKDWLIENYCQNGSKFGGHVTYGSCPQIHATAGSLWHGLPIGCWFAFWNRRRNVFIITGDGELNEGSNWESAMFAYHHHLSNLVWIIDRNGQQSFGPTKETIDIHNLTAILNWFGWHVQEIDGNNRESIQNAFENLSTKFPNVIIADTIKWKGVSFMEGKTEFHYKPPTEKQLEQALSELN